MGTCTSRHRVKIGSRSRPRRSGLEEYVARLKASNVKRVYTHAVCYTCIPSDGTWEKWDDLDEDDPAWDTDAASCFSVEVGKVKNFPISTWDYLQGDGPMWDTDAASCFSDLSDATYETEAYSLCRTVPEGDQAWDTDAASCFSSELSGSVSESSFGSFSGPGSFSESVSSSTSE